MTKEITIFGPPGTGKTTTLIDLVKSRIKVGGDPNKIAFMSFSRKAATEARDRAMGELNLNADQKNNVIEFLNMLEEDDDVQKFYINLDLKGL